MAAAHEFYDYADEHFGWAETAKTERERAIFLQMAPLGASRTAPDLPNTPIRGPSPEPIDKPADDCHDA